MSPYHPCTVPHVTLWRGLEEKNLDSSSDKNKFENVSQEYTRCTPNDNSPSVYNPD